MALFWQRWSFWWKRLTILQKWTLANDILCLYIGTHPQGHRLTKLTIMRPLGKLDLDDQNGFDPMAALHHGGGCIQARKITLKQDAKAGSLCRPLIR